MLHLTLLVQCRRLHRRLRGRRVAAVRGNAEVVEIGLRGGSHRGWLRLDLTADGGLLWLPEGAPAPAASRTPLLTHLGRHLAGGRLVEVG
ncbi:MAG: hypothetical protein D6739_05290, partial [Nitrospirae bacterium]